ncbi:hypothetical protein ACSQ67_001154 [Phaseolus vulgaris]
MISTGQFMIGNILNRESYNEKVSFEDRSTNLMLNEHNIDRIMEMSPYSDVRKEAYHFIRDRFPPCGSNTQEIGVAGRNCLASCRNKAWKDI